MAPIITLGKDTSDVFRGLSGWRTDCRPRLRAVPALGLDPEGHLVSGARRERLLDGVRAMLRTGESLRIFSYTFERCLDRFRVAFAYMPRDEISSLEGWQIHFCHPGK